MSCHEIRLGDAKQIGEPALRNDGLERDNTLSVAGRLNC